MITYVYTDYEDCEYITAGKLYEATLNSEGFCFLDDEGEWLYQNFNQGSHINNKPWSIHKSNYRVWDRVEDVCSGYVKSSPIYEKVNLGEVTGVITGGIYVLWEGCSIPYFCAEDDVKPYVMPVVEPEDDVEEPFVGHFSEPFGWPSFENVVLYGTPVENIRVEMDIPEDWSAKMEAFVNEINKPTENKIKFEYFGGLPKNKDPYLCCGTTDEWHSEDSAQDNVNSPSHYGAGSIECIEYIKDFLTTEEYIGYLRGNIAKYLHRWRYKNGLEDLEKAQVYLGWLKEVVKDDTTED